MEEKIKIGWHIACNKYEPDAIVITAEDTAICVPLSRYIFEGFE